MNPRPLRHMKEDGDLYSGLLIIDVAVVTPIRSSNGNWNSLSEQRQRGSFWEAHDS